MLHKHLSGLERTMKISVWLDEKMRAGTEWNSDILINLREAHVILLLISPDFIASKFCYTIEMAEAFILQQNKKLLIIPVFLSPILHDDHPFNALQSLPSQPRYYSDWDDKNAACVDICKGIKEAIEHYIKDIVSIKKSEIEDCIVSGDIAQACKNLIGLANDFSDKESVRAAMVISASYNNIIKRDKGDYKELKMIAMEILVLMDTIVPQTSLIKAA